MSWTFKVAEWNVEVDWEGLTVTPPATPADFRRPPEPADETPGCFELLETQTLDDGETQAWA